MLILPRIAIFAVLAGLLGGCGSAPATASPTVAPTPTPTSSPTASPPPTPTPTLTLSPAPTPTARLTLPPAPTATPTPTSPTASPSGAVIVTFDVNGERYRVLVIDPDQIAIANALLAGDPAPSIPNGLIVRGDTDINTGWSWHIDPQDFEFADMTIELCDGLPSYVEDGTLSGDRFCPWSAVVISVEPAQ